MELRTLGQVIARRTYTLITESGAKEEVIVRVGEPQAAPGQGDFYCPFEIVGLGSSRIKWAFGVDAIQALQLALKMMGAELHYYRNQTSGSTLYLHEESDDLGFPEAAWTEGPRWHIVRAFGPIYGMKLSMARSAGNWNDFQFGALRPHPNGKGTVGQYTLQVLCPWRFVQAQCAWRLPAGSLIMSGSGDGRDPGITAANDLAVQQIDSDDYGGIDIHLTGYYRLQVFPDGNSNEQWRLFQPGSGAPHVVFESGALRADSPKS